MNYSRNTDGSYRTITRTRYNAEGNPPVSAQKSLVSNLSDTSESKNLTIDERNLTSTQWEEYHNRTKRKTYNTLPTSNITAEAVSADGFTLRQTDNAGVTSTAGCHLDIQKDGTWYTYGWDLTKNICELYGQHGYIRTNYTFTPYGAVTAGGDVTQPIQWSSEFHDDELALVYYNYRHYNPTDGRWLGRDLIEDEYIRNLFVYTSNSPIGETDYIGLFFNVVKGRILGIINVLKQMSNFIIQPIHEYFGIVDDYSKKKGEFIIQRYRKFNIYVFSLKASISGVISSDGCCASASIGMVITATAKGLTALTLAGGLTINSKVRFKSCWFNDSQSLEGLASGGGYLGIRFGLAAGGKFVEAFVEAGVTLSYTYDFNKEKGGWGTGWYARIVASTLFFEYQYKISEGSSEIDFE